MKFVCSLIAVEDIEKSKYLYETVLGQTVKSDFGENVAFHGDFAIHQKSHFKGLIQQLPVSSRANNFELYFETDDLEEVVQKIQEADLTIIHGIQEQPWRQKVVRFYDYDYHIIEVGERLEHLAFRLSQEGLSINEIEKITYLPEEAIRKAISEYSGGTYNEF
jgi:catechol 2,3-dioxygenase-like lactoylglutathione lyase family enzyme